MREFAPCLKGRIKKTIILICHALEVRARGDRSFSTRNKRYIKRKSHSRRCTTKMTNEKNWKVLVYNRHLYVHIASQSHFFLYIFFHYYYYTVSSAHVELPKRLTFLFLFFLLSLYSRMLMTTSCGKVTKTCLSLLLAMKNLPKKKKKK